MGGAFTAPIVSGFQPSKGSTAVDRPQRPQIDRRFEAVAGTEAAHRT